MNRHQRHDEFEKPEAVDFSRRSFLKLSGFTFAGTVLAGCTQAQVDKAIPFLIQPEEITPGVAYWYATTCGGCNAGCGILAKNRDGRPIKLEGNPAHPLSKGGLCSIGQAHLLSLYDSQRLSAPMSQGKESTWIKVDEEIKNKLSEIRRKNGTVRVLTRSVTSPTTRAAITKFLGDYKNARHIEYDPVSYSAILDAHKITHGSRTLPRYHFEKAEIILSVDADFLGTWISPVEFTKGYRAGRTLEGNPPLFSYHAQVESRMSLTGTNADRRVKASPWEFRKILGALVHSIATGTRATSKVERPTLSAEHEKFVEELSERLLKKREKSIVVCGLNDLDSQILVNAANAMLGNYATTVDIRQPSSQYRGDDAKLRQLLDEITTGDVDAMFVQGNPVYDLPNGTGISKALRKIPLVVSFSERLDETSSEAAFICPQPHELECWNDSETGGGVFSVSQPVIQPLRKSRTMLESFSRWAGIQDSAEELVKRFWENQVFPKRKSSGSFQEFWNRTLMDGFASLRIESRGEREFDPSSLRRIRKSAAAASVMHLVLHPSHTMLDGRHSHNPWLHELPDPVTKITWENHVSIAPSTAATLGIANGDVVHISLGDTSLELPAFIQKGQEESTLAVALGYGRIGTDRFANIHARWLQAKPTVLPGETIGKNAATFLEFDDGSISFVRTGVSIRKTGRAVALARSQEYDSLQNPDMFGEKSDKKRPIIQQASLAAFAVNRSAGSFHRTEVQSMWADDHTYSGHRWGMSIDLTACTGCSACVIGCMAENNIPVVGKDEVGRNRDLQWMRIDRYIDEEDGQLSVSHQPMLCQHCGNAPCETVCPVLATVHDSEGLNQQVYNRCVGTRYCANNCPYKVRHFNWFQYPRGDELQRMVLNPDVTVRDRGVMEKCTFCVQRIQLAKIEAKNEGRELKDGDIKTACEQSCPADAIVFGDMNDPTSAVSKKMKDVRSYRVLEEIGVQPSIGYLTQVRNTDTKTEADRG
ncbi:MAG: Molybdopterin oxidoreductase [Bacteroidetes bacterium]|nr:Molybdopterin oxidoreductase [Bacteroidota bacterium]